MIHKDVPYTRAEEYEAIESTDVEDSRLYKHKKNIHTKNVLKHQKLKMQQNLS